MANRISIFTWTQLELKFTMVISDAPKHTENTLLMTNTYTWYVEADVSGTRGRESLPYIMASISPFFQTPHPSHTQYVDQ